MLKRKEYEKREMRVYMCPTFERQKVRSFWCKEANFGSKKNLAAKVGIFLVQKCIFGLKIQEEHFGCFFLPLQSFSGGVRHLFSTHHSSKQRTHVFDESVFGDFDEDDDEDDELLFVSERREDDFEKEQERHFLSSSRKNNDDDVRRF